MTLKSCGDFTGLIYQPGYKMIVFSGSPWVLTGTREGCLHHSTLLTTYSDRTHTWRLPSPLYSADHVLRPDTHVKAAFTTLLCWPRTQTVRTLKIVWSHRNTVYSLWRKESVTSMFLEWLSECALHTWTLTLTLISKCNAILSNHTEHTDH